MKKELLGLLACPKCKGNVQPKKMFLICGSCKLAYPILGEIPDMLMENAWDLEKAKKTGFKHSLKL